VLLFILVVVVGGWGLTRSGFVRGAVMARVEEVLACESTCSSVSFSLGGQLVVRNLSMRVPGLDGDAGEFLRAGRAVVDMSILELLSGGSGTVRSITLDRARIRLSQSEDLRLNIEGLEIGRASCRERV